MARATLLECRQATEQARYGKGGVTMATQDQLHDMKARIYHLLDGDYGTLSWRQEEVILRLKADVEFLEAFARISQPLLANCTPRASTNS